MFPLSPLLLCCLRTVWLFLSCLPKALTGSILPPPCPTLWSGRIDGSLLRGFWFLKCEVFRWCWATSLGPWGKDPDAGKYRGQEEKGTTEDELSGLHHWLNRHDFEQTLGWWRTGKSDMLQCMGSQRIGHNWATKQQQQDSLQCPQPFHGMDSGSCSDLYNRVA